MAKYQDAATLPSTTPTVPSTAVDELLDVSRDAIGGENLSRSYYRSPRFMGTVAGLCLSVTSNYAAYLMPVTVISHINADIGPSKNYVWVPLIWSITLSIGYTLNGRLSDLFGRRWFVVGGNALALIGLIICATAINIPMLIGGNVLVGFGGAVQLSFTSVISELVPVKDRGLWVGLILFSTIPTSMFGPYISHAVVADASWRWCYYIAIIFSALAVLLLIAFYFPPSFEKLHFIKSKRDLITHLDFVGIFLYTAGVVLFVLGFSWGGSVYAWRSAPVISTIVIGALVLVIFFFWESRAKEPLIPFRFFTTNKSLFLAPLVTGMGGGMFFYGLNIIWPLQIAAVFGASTDLKLQGWLSCSLTCGSGLGAILAGIGFKVIGHQRIQLIVLYGIIVIFCGVMSTTNVDKRDLAIVCAFFTGFGVGAVEVICTLVSLVSKDVGYIGLIVGSVGTFRSLAGSVAQAIYVTILENKLTTEIPTEVTKAAIAAGLPQTSLPALFQAIGTQSLTALEKVPGMTQQILLAVEYGEVQGYTKAFAYVYYACIAFGGASFICAFFVVFDVNEYMSAYVARKLQGVSSQETTDPEKSKSFENSVDHLEAIGNNIKAEGKDH